MELCWLLKKLTKLVHGKAYVETCDSNILKSTNKLSKQQSIYEVWTIIILYEVEEDKGVETGLASNMLNHCNKLQM